MNLTRNEKENEVSKMKGKRKRKSVIIYRLGFVVFVTTIFCCQLRHNIGIDLN